MTNPGLPSNVAQIFVAGTFRNFQGNALAQRLVLSPSLTVTINAGAEEVTLASEFSATPDPMTGFVSIPVVATDDPDLNPSNFTYTVTEPSGRKYPLAVSQDTPVFTRAGHPLSGQRVVWLHSAVPAPGPSSGVVQIVAGPQGAPGPAGTGVLVDGSPVSALNVVSTAVGLADLAGFNTATAAQVTTIAGLTHANDTILQTKAGAWAARTPAQLKTDLALTKGDVGLGNVDNTSDANKPLSTAALAALAAPPPAPGQYWYTASSHNSGTSATLGVGTLRVVAVLVRSPMTLTRLAADVATAGEAGSKFRIGMYADDGFGRPGTLLVDAGQVAGDSATVQELTISVALQPGVYWIGGVVQAVTTTQPTIRTVTSWQPPLPISAGSALPAAGQNGVGYSANGVTGALPATFAMAGPASSAARIIAKVA